MSVAEKIQTQESFNILLVDDDDTDRHYYTELINSTEGYQCKQLVASSLKEARQLVAVNDNIDCVLLDYKLRDGTSDTLLKELKDSEASPAVIVFTSFIDKQKAIDLLRMGAHDYLDKRMITREMLSRCIRYGIERSKSEKLQGKLKAEQEANRLQGDFISIISHEFKNPIHVIGMSINMIRKKMASQLSIIENYVDNITTSTSQMRHLLEQTVHFARFDADSIEVNLQKTDVNTLLTRDIERFKMMHPNRDFPLAAGQASDLPHIHVDDALYRQVIDNVIGNAIKYSDEGKPVNFLLVVSDEYVSIRVQDYGRGIPKEDLDRIGQKFYRASNSDGVQGTGMGLYLVHSLMELMGGSCRVESREGVGTVVTLGFKRA